MNAPLEARWLLLIHQLPPKPAYLRVKIWRRLQRLGAVPVKNAVYALPKNEQTQEDFQWVLREIVQAGGDASLCDARFIEGISDDQLEQLFRCAREDDFQQIGKQAARIADRVSKKRKWPADQKRALAVELERLQKRLAEIVAIDFFGASGRDAAERQLFALGARLHEPGDGATAAKAKRPIQDLKRRTWVTRKGIHVDRMASAWFIRRFVDTESQFKFVNAKGYQPQPEELRFDMYEAEFTHEGDLCTLEVLFDRVDVKDPAVRKIAEIVHDIDLKDGKFGHEETAGIDRLIAGVAMAHSDDEARLARAIALFDDLYEYFRRKSR
ncbi:MAG: chromate resistance protein [Deltaproteobacteria bacterium]|nr:chromate resistance protein [Deltaproteobacteria bacterium]